MTMYRQVRRIQKNGERMQSSIQNEIERISHVERKYVEEVLNSQFRASTNVNMMAKLEKKFAQVFNMPFAISFINGTATLHTALISAGVGYGDEVIVPPLTMASTSLAVLQSNAIPVFADIDPTSWTIDPLSIKKNITPRTKAIITVSIYGLSPDMDAIMEIAHQHKLFVLEDNAQCFLGYYKNKLVGTMGHASSYSFQSSKHMTSGEGGMIITGDKELAEKIRRLNTLGYKAVGANANQSKISKFDIQSPDYERHSSIGWNYRMPELCAAVALGQLERLHLFVDMRQQIAKLYDEVLSDCNWLTSQQSNYDCIHSYWSYVLKLSKDTSLSWHQFRNKFVDFGGDSIYGAWQLTYLEPAFCKKQFFSMQQQQFQKGLCPIAEKTQPFLLQFKTNYLKMEKASKQAEALLKTVHYFS